MQDPLWKTKDGRIMRIGAMGMVHIRNILNMMDRYPRWRQQWRSRLELELEMRRYGYHGPRKK